MNTQKIIISPTIENLEIKISSLDKDTKNTLFDTENTINTLLLRTDFSFQDFLSLIDKRFNFTPCKFSIGDTHNAQGENIGILKVVAYAIMMGYDTEETLKLFGEHYQNVLDNPNTESHANIRALIRYEISSVSISGTPLTLKKDD